MRIDRYEPVLKRVSLGGLLEFEFALAIAPFLPVPCSSRMRTSTTMQMLPGLRGPSSRQAEAYPCGAVELEISEILVPHLGKTVGIYGSRPSLTEKRNGQRCRKIQFG